MTSSLPKGSTPPTTPAKSLAAWLDHVLEKSEEFKAPRSQSQSLDEAKEAVIEALKQQSCTDEKTLSDCWDDLKEKVPEIPRTIISQELLECWLDLVLVGSKMFSGPQSCNAAKKAVMEALKQQMCVDRQSLRDHWDDLKGSVPGVPRSVISQWLANEQYKQVEAEPEVFWRNWLKGLGIAGLVIALPTSIAINKDRDGEPEEIMYRHVYQVWVPWFVIVTAQIMFCSFLGPKVGYDVIEERSTSVNLRESMRNTLTNQAVIGALFLTVVWAMAQADPPITDGVDSFEAYFVSQWYLGFLAAAIGQLLIAIMECCFVLMYIEPLDDISSLKFVKDNFSYFSEPIALILVALYNAICASILWVYGAYGGGMGVCFTLISTYAMLRIVVVYMYLGQWKNPYLTKDEIARRRDEVEVMVVHGGQIHELRDSSAGWDPSGDPDPPRSPVQHVHVRARTVAPATPNLLIGGRNVAARRGWVGKA